MYFVLGTEGPFDSQMNSEVDIIQIIGIFQAGSVL